MTSYTGGWAFTSKNSNGTYADIAQRAEGSSATAQILKAIAEQRGWEHSRHRHHLVTVSRLRAETGDGDVRRLFNTASITTTVAVVG